MVFNRLFERAMSSQSTFPERLLKVFQPTSLGVVGLVDDLLSLCRERELQLDWQSQRCLVRTLGSGPQESMELPLQKSVFRAILARMAVLCNEQIPNSVSPYGGEGQVIVASDSRMVFRVVFTNTPSSQSLGIKRVVDDNGVARSDKSCGGLAANTPMS
jgi:hypothetical protein